MALRHFSIKYFRFFLQYLMLCPLSRKISTILKTVLFDTPSFKDNEIAVTNEFDSIEYFILSSFSEYLR